MRDELRPTAGGRFNIKMSSCQYRDSHVNKDGLIDCLIFNMGIPIPGKDSLYIEMGPSVDSIILLWMRVVVTHLKWNKTGSWEMIFSMLIKTGITTVLIWCSITDWTGKLTAKVSCLIARFMGQHGAHLGLIGPRWAPCWPNELCYLGYHHNAPHYDCRVSFHLVIPYHFCQNAR